MTTQKQQRYSLLFKLVPLTLCLVITMFVVLFWNRSVVPEQKMIVAATVCWVSDICSVLWVVHERNKSPQQIAGVWGGILPRFAGVLIAGIVAMIFYERHVASAFFGYLVVFHLGMLPATVWATFPDRD